MKKIIFILLPFFLFAIQTVYAQPNNSVKPWFSHMSGGYMEIAGDTDSALKDGWNLNFGATYWPSDWKAGLVFDFGFHEADLTRAALDIADSDGGGVDVWSLTTGIVWGKKLSSTVGIEVSLAAGMYTIDAHLTEPGLYIGPICDPWLWYCYPGVIPGDVITESIWTTRFGYNGSLALVFDITESAQFYIQARYNIVETSRVSAEFTPINIGFRF